MICSLSALAGAAAMGLLASPVALAGALRDEVAEKIFQRENLYLTIAKYHGRLKV
jgi:mannitol/fructose-specific phosphotransferase system IIA component (Ntr-type)